MNSKLTYISLLLLVFLSSATCSDNSNNTENGAEVEEDKNRPTTFASDEEFLDFIQKTHFNYMWEGAETTSGLAPERIHMDGNYPQNDADVVTTGGSGFGIAGLIVAIERGFISRNDGVKRLYKIADYLDSADRIHGMWPHWLYGKTGKVIQRFSLKVAFTLIGRIMGCGSAMPWKQAVVYVLTIWK